LQDSLVLEELLCEALTRQAQVCFGQFFHHLGTLDLHHDGFLIREELDGVKEAGGRRLREGKEPHG
jgi:hypothetical protein